MKEKEAIKISLSTFFLILAVIAIVIMGYFIFILNSEKNSETEKVSKLNNQISELEEKSSNLQEKIDNISNTINSNTTNESSSQSSTLTESEALSLGNEKYQKVLDLIPQEDTSIILNTNKNDGNNPWYKLTNISEIKTLLSDKAFEYFCSEYSIKEFNGTYGHYASNRGSTPEYLESEIKKVDNITENQITYTTLSKYAVNLSDKDGTDISKITNFTTQENKLVLTKENNEWKISEYTIPY